ncbi:GTPase HflX, partial [Nocardia tengchongensis]
MSKPETYEFTPAEDLDEEINDAPETGRNGWSAAPTVGEQQLEERAALRRVAGLSTELEDVTEVEYRQLRLERVVLVGVWTEG